MLFATLYQFSEYHSPAICTVFCLNVVGLSLGETDSSVVICIDLDYAICLVVHLILIVLRKNIVKRSVMRGGQFNVELETCTNSLFLYYLFRRFVI